MFEAYKNRMAYRGKNISEMLRAQSNMVIEQTWDRDPNFRQVYVVKVNSGLPEVTSAHELIDVKFNVKSYQTITSDEVAYMLQFRHGEEKRHPEISIGSYVYMEDEDGKWKWWMLIHLDERPAFRQYQILECNWTFGWVVEGKIYHCLGIQRVQQGGSNGLQNGTHIVSVDSTTSAWLPTNNDTLTIGYNQKFIISDPKRRPPLVWEIAEIKDAQPIGLTKLKFTQVDFDPIHDNPELMLASYYDSAIEPEVPNIEAELASTATITHNGSKPTVKVGGSWKVFTPAFSNADAVVSKWMISDEHGDISTNDNYIIERDGEKLKLKVALDYNLVGTVLIVQLIGSDNSTAELKVEVVS